MLQGEPPVRHAPTRGARFRWVLVGIVRAGIPALAFVALQLSPLALEGGLEIYVGVSVALWALVSLLAAVDPQFAAKIDALQNLASSWPSGDRKV
jgi:hypothetical protein